MSAGGDDRKIAPRPTGLRIEGSSRVRIGTAHIEGYEDAVSIARSDDISIGTLTGLSASSAPTKREWVPPDDGRETKLGWWRRFGDKAAEKSPGLAVDAVKAAAIALAAKFRLDLN